MASPNPSCPSDFPALDAKARDNFNKKLSKSDLYIPDIPKHLQLEFFFRNYNDIARGSYLPHSSKYLDVNRAIWYYEVSKQHSLSNRNYVTRFNIVPMAFIMIAKKLDFDTSSYYEPGAEAFFSAYIEAWLAKTCGLEEHEHFFQEELVRTGMNGVFDLCYFPDKARKEMGKAVWTLQQMVSELTTIQPESFYAAVLSKEVLCDIFEKEGPMLVLHWVFAKIKKEQERKASDADADVDMEERVDFFVDTSPVRMDRSPVSDLLVDIEPGVVEQGLPLEDRKPWITAAQALRIVQGVEKDFLTLAMEKATLGRE